MLQLAHLSTQAEILLKSDMFGTLIAGYVALLLLLAVSFVNIYSVDKNEFLYNKQKCVEFKHKLFFVIMYAKEKHIVSIKTFVLNIIGYVLSILSVAVCLYSFKQDVTLSFVLLGIMAVLICSFGCVTGFMYGKTKKYTKNTR